MVAQSLENRKSPIALALLAHAVADLDAAADALAHEARQRERGALAANALRTKRLASVVQHLAGIVAADLRETEVPAA